MFVLDVVAVVCWHRLMLRSLHETVFSAPVFVVVVLLALPLFLDWALPLAVDLC